MLSKSQAIVLLLLLSFLILNLQEPLYCPFSEENLDSRKKPPKYESMLFVLDETNRTHLICFTQNSIKKIDQKNSVLNCRKSVDYRSSSGNFVFNLQQIDGVTQSLDMLAQIKQRLIKSTSIIFDKFPLIKDCHNMIFHYHAWTTDSKVYCHARMREIYLHTYQYATSLCPTMKPLLCTL